ncbi:MAG TPA: 3-oxoacyl-[acyl-carrier-protein] synthase III C-terminal domain-containing protein [Nakamurella sp.]|nr:3-oxoacyl-[acyl-carrier-protein] synthase III C-terminal domain-containing protein [Nakamurella sp.]
MTVFVDDIHVALGDVRRDVRTAQAAGATLSTSQQLTDAGFGTHYVCSDDMTAYDLARLAVTPIAARHRRVVAIVYATTLPGNAAMGGADDFARTGDVKHLMRYPASRLQAEFDFAAAFVVGVGQQACTGLLGALRLARGLLLAEPHLDPILCLTADRFPAGAGYEQAYNLVSDGAVACTVSLRPAAFELLGVHHVTNGGLEFASDDETVATYFSYTCEVITAVCAVAGFDPQALNWIVPQNTHSRVAPILARLLGLPEDRLYCPTVRELGHLIAGDALVNLADLQKSGRLRAGDLVAVPIAGYGLNWQCALLRATAAPD